MTVERIHPKAPVMLIFIAIFTCLPTCINLSNIETNKQCPNKHPFIVIIYDSYYIDYLIYMLAHHEKSGYTSCMDV